MINSTLKRAVIGQPEPTVGMAATFLSYSDRSPGTIVDVTETRGVTFIKVQGDHARVIKGSTHDSSAEYEFTRDTNAGTLTFRRNPDGIWQCVVFNEETNRWNKRESPSLRIGERDCYYDPSF